MSLLEVEEVHVSFGGLKALDEVALAVEYGSVTGLIGPNGAGKTTLFDVVTGLREPDRGRILLDGQDITGRKPHDRARLGIGRTFQRLEIFGSLTVRENLLVAAEIHGSWKRDASDPEEVTEALLDAVRLRPFEHDRADELSTGHARLIELGRALATEPRVLLLDEPSSGLDEDETDDFADLLHGFAAEGLAILLVEHDVDLVMKVCSMIHVLDFGRVLAVGTPREIRGSEAVQAAYLGTTAGTGGGG